MIQWYWAELLLLPVTSVARVSVTLKETLVGVTLKETLVGVHFYVRSLVAARETSCAGVREARARDAMVTFVEQVGIVGAKKSAAVLVVAASVEVAVWMVSGYQVRASVVKRIEGGVFVKVIVSCGPSALRKRSACPWA